jgi:hypothetical protein
MSSFDFYLESNTLAHNIALIDLKKSNAPKCFEKQKIITFRYSKKIRVFGKD